ncbi:hypothetical protein SynA1560_02162 [Synechococcus sp. A15-60]|nr:hypothetical protein SynA1560_02162 [Synechococcus sp. A15-60]
MGPRGITGGVRGVQNLIANRGAISKPLRSMSALDLQL